MNPKYRVFAVLGLVFLLSLGFYIYSTRGTREVVLIGTVDADQVIVSSKVAGRITQLAVVESQKVKQGDLIAQIDKQDLIDEANSARADMDSLRAQVQQSRDNYASTRGDTEAQVANAEASLKAAQATLQESEANERQQALDTARTVALAEQGVSSQQDRDRAEQTLAADQAHVRASRDQVNAARATLLSMKAHLNQAAAAFHNIASVQQQMDSDKAKLAEDEVRIGYTRIVAPVDGSRHRARRSRRRGGQRRHAHRHPRRSHPDLGLCRDSGDRGADRKAGRHPARCACPPVKSSTARSSPRPTEADFATERDYSRTKRDIRTVRLKLLIPNPGETYVPGMTAEVLLPHAGK